MCALFGDLYRYLPLPFLWSCDFEGSTEDRELQGYKDTELLSMSASGNKKVLNPLTNEDHTPWTSPV